MKARRIVVVAVLMFLLCSVRYVKADILSISANQLKSLNIWTGVAVPASIQLRDNTDYTEFIISQFDVSSIGALSTINSAHIEFSFQFFAGTDGPHTVQLKRIYESWDTTVTYNEYMAIDAWPNGGRYPTHAYGDSIQTDEGMVIGTDGSFVSPGGWFPTGFHTFSVDATDFVTNWVQGAYGNNGVALHYDYDAVSVGGGFQHGQVLQPVLVVDYTVPEPATILILATGALVSLRRKKA